MPLAGAKLDAVSGKVKWVAAVTARATGSCLGDAVSQQPLPSRTKGSTAQVASVTDMTLPSDPSTVSFFLMELRSVNMGESRIGKPWFITCNIQVEEMAVNLV